MAVDLSKLTDRQLLDMKGGRLDRLPVDVLRAMKNVGKKPKKPKFETEAEIIKNISPEDLAIASAPGRFVGGAAKPFIGAAQLAARGLPFDAPKEYMDRVVKESAAAGRRGDIAYGREGFDWMDLLGGIMTPAGLKIGKSLPASTSGKISVGAGTGLGFGAVAPVEDTENFKSTKASQVAFGGLLGTTLPTGLALGKWSPKVIKHILEPLFKSGRQAIKSREYIAAAGSKADDIVGLLDDAKQIVPGSRPTAAEAAAPAGRAEFAAMQKAASAHRPSDFLARSNEQQAARTTSLAGVAKTPQELKSAIGTRAANAVKNYALAFQRQAKTDPELSKIASNPFFKSAVRDATRIAKADRFDPKTEPTRFYHLVKLGLDKQLGKVGDNALGSAERKAVQGVKSRLVGWLEKNVPEYEVARTQYASESAPINRMMVGQELQKTLSPPVKDIAEVGKQRLGPFAAAMRDSAKVVKKAGQDPRFGELKDILTKPEMKRVSNIAEDLARRAQFEEQAIAGARSGKGNIVAAQLQRETGASTAPNALIRPVMIFNAVLKRIQGKAGEEVEREIALEMLDPKTVAAVMKQAMIPKRRIADFLAKLELLSGKPFGTNPLRTPSFIAGGTLQGDIGGDEILNVVHPH
jgi:hypothetical protein